MKSGFF